MGTTHKRKDGRKKRTEEQQQRRGGLATRESTSATRQQHTATYTNRASYCNVKDNHIRRRTILNVSIAAPLLLCMQPASSSNMCDALEIKSLSFFESREAKIRRMIKSVIENNGPRLPAILRLAFHDAGTYDATRKRGGANASVRYELDRPENAGLKRATRVIDGLFKDINGFEPALIDSGLQANQVICSYADIIAISGALAVEVSGGPRIDVGLGRIDATSGDDVGMLPEEKATGAELKEIFKRMGLDTQDLISLSGAHTLGGKG